MRHNSYNSEEFSQKVQKFRKEIRHRQIEEHKQKIRSHYEPSNKIFNQISNQHQKQKNWVDNVNNNCKKENKQFDCNLSIFIQQKIDNICNTLQLLQNKCIQQFPKQLNGESNESNKLVQYKQLCENIHLNYGLLIDLLIHNQMENKQENSSQQNCEQKQQKQFIIFAILCKISKLSKIGVHVWDSEQRCAISYSMQKYLLEEIHKYEVKKKQGRNNLMQNNWDAPTQRLAIVVLYIMNIMIKDVNVDLSYQYKYEHIKNNYQIFDFTLIEQSILIHLVAAISLLLENIDMPSQIKKYLLEVQASKKQQCFSLQSPPVLKIINGLTNLYIFYIKLYSREAYSTCINNTTIRQQQNGVELTNQCLDQETGDIGNVSLSCIKAVLGIAVHVLAISSYCVSNDSSLLKKTNSVTSFLVIQMAKTVNYTIDLFHQFFIIIQSFLQQQFKTLEDETSTSIHETILGIQCLLCDTIVNIVEHLKEIQEYGQYKVEKQIQNIYLSLKVDENKEAQSTIKNEQKWSEIFFKSLKNKEIIQGLHLLIERKLYTQQYINQIYNSSKLSIYLITCIFSCQTNMTEKQQKEQNSKTLHYDKNQGKCISYEKYRQCQSKFQQRICLQLECLKTIEVFQKNYGIKVDIEDNLQIRYLSKIGNGSVNQYYYQNLAGLRSYVK